MFCVIMPDSSIAARGFNPPEINHSGLPRFNGYLKMRLSRFF